MERNKAQNVKLKTKAGTMTQIRKPLRWWMYLNKKYVYLVLWRGNLPENEVEDIKGGLCCPPEEFRLLWPGLLAICPLATPPRTGKDEPINSKYIFQHLFDKESSSSGKVLDEGSANYNLRLMWIFFWLLFKSGVVERDLKKLFSRSEMAAQKTWCQRKWRAKIEWRKGKYGSYEFLNWLLNMDSIRLE